MATIYQITDYPKNESTFISACIYEDSWFVPAIAEYVRDCADRQAEICSLMNMLKANQLAVTDRETNSFVLLPNARNIYFEGRYKQFQRNLVVLSQIPEDKFICCHSEVEGLLYQLNRSFSNQFDTYIADDGDELIPFDEFMRTADEGVTYYVGGTVNYHM